MGRCLSPRFPLVFAMITCLRLPRLGVRSSRVRASLIRRRPLAPRRAKNGPPCAARDYARPPLGEIVPRWRPPAVGKSPLGYTWVAVTPRILKLIVPQPVAENRATVVPRAIP